ncbi:MAG: hypothetical protein Q8M09_08835 [Pseudomonadota bacterium]|nr:hypothetical protein [Pseudomonadota bacterium]MDP1904334.1 hypothetical protein [Pseudomonadota bacterium]MDP2353461.1 hypothetical protein [Pseudomonadota bacterium]
MKYTQYFLVTRQRPDRVSILEAWIERAVQCPDHEYLQSDGRIRRWIQVKEMEGKWLRVVLLSDGETVHNAFFDRRFKP